MAKSKAEAKPEKKTSKKEKNAKPEKAAKSAGKKKKKKAEASPLPKDYMPRLKKQYYEQVVPSLMQTFQYKNKMQVPRLEKIVVNIGIGEATQNPKILESAVQDIMTITGQKPVITKAKKSISNFKLRQGVAIGCMVTLRGNWMYEFLDRLISLAIPRVRDFRGLSDRSFDGRGNYNIGVKEQIIFPEVDYDKVEKVRGLDIAIATNANSDEEAFEMLKAFGMPFRKN